MKNRKVIIALFILGLLLTFPITANADVGPKPQITIVVENPPVEEYYLDLLIDKNYSRDNLGDKRSQYDKKKLALLENYNTDGWYAGLAHGTGIPMWGDLKGVKSGDAMTHTFGYMGVPEYFKIIIVKPGNTLSISEEIHRNTFQYKMIYDYDTGKISHQNIAISYLAQFLMTCIPTLIIEGIILILFRFSIRSNWKAFLGINLATQILLTATLGTILLKQGIFAGYLAFIPLEIIILAFEAIMFSKLLNQHKVKRRVMYAVIANITSAIAGWLIIWYEFIIHFF